jgi:hypothetical protein
MAATFIFVLFIALAVFSAERLRTALNELSLKRIKIKVYKKRTNKKNAKVAKSLGGSNISLTSLDQTS